MKKILLLLVLLLSIAKAQGQTFDWSSAMPVDPYISGLKAKSLMYQGKLYHFSDSIGTYIRVTMYNPEVGSWRWLAVETTYIGSIGEIEGEVVNNKAYLVTASFSGLFIHKFDFTTNTIVGYNSFIGTGGLGGWKFKADPISETLVVMYRENTEVNICTFNTTTNIWNNVFDATTILDPTFSYGNYLIYFSSTSIFYGISGSGNNRLAIAPINAPTALSYYNSTGTNDGRLKTGASTNFVSGNYFLVGNGQNPPLIYMRNYANQTTYEKTLSGTNNVQLNTGTDQTLPFNIDTNNFVSTQNASYSFILSNFNVAGNPNFGDSYVFKKDWTTGIWDTLGIQIPLTAGLNDQFLISLDAGGQHVAVNYQNDGYYYSKVFNTQPEINLGSIAPTTGTCTNHQNLIYHALEFYDDNKDGPLKILNLIDQSGTITGMTAQLIYFDNTTSPALTKYAIYGNIGASSGNALIQFQLFDGYSIQSISLPSITVGTTTAPVVNFTPNPLFLCSNDNLIDLTNYVNYYDHGTFSINGNPVVGTTIDGAVVSQTFTAGSITLNDEINGCMITTSASVSFPLLASASVVSTPSTCGATTGTATVTFTAGSSSNYNLEWSTGEITTTISNLAPGPYYYSATDDYNCHFTGATSVDATGITITPTITNVSCNGLNNGSISIAIVNPNTYHFVWSNGYGTPTISNLAPGSYSVNVWDDNGCQVSGSYIVTQPAPITGSFFATEPSCGATDGSINSFINGTGTLNYNWVGMGQTTPTLNNVGHGLYTLQVSDGNGCIKEFTYQLDDLFSVDINTSILKASCNQANGGVTVNLVQNPNGGPANSWSWSNGTTTQSNFNLAAGSYTITATSGSINQPCYSQKTILVGTRAPLAQPICLVTVDTATTTNLVVWGKTETSGISHYNIYRESDLAGNYQLIDTVHADNLSYFNDVVASPMNRSWRYKMSAVNGCGTESPISTEHKTLHLNTILNVGNGSFEVLWDDYEGSGNVTGYVVWRKTDQVDWIAVSPTIALGTSLYNDIPPTGSTGVDYYIEMLTNSTCTAEKAQDFNTTRSNRERGQFSAGTGVEGASSNTIGENYLNEIKMYPNPTTDKLTFVQEGNEQVTYNILSLSGQLMQTNQSNLTNTILDLSPLNAGVYLVELKMNDTKITKRVIKL